MQNNEQLNDFGKSSDGSGYAFISYSSKNQQKADAVRMLLKKKGIRCWMAPYDIPAGSKYAYVINDALENCACLVLLLSVDSQKSQFVGREVERAITYNKTIVTLQLDNVVLNSGFKFYIGSEQIVAVHDIDENSPEMKKIIAGIKSFTGTVETPEKKITDHAAKNTEAPSVTVKIAAETKEAEARKAAEKQTQQTMAVQPAVTECPENAEDEIVKFHNADFEKAFRKKYRIKGDIALKTILGFTELNLRESKPKLWNISDIAMFKNLTSLDLCDNEISDITPLAGLANLTTLYLSRNQISNITPLAGLAKLTDLYLSSNKISDITPLAGLVNLTLLSFCGNQISDIAPLAGLVNLIKLDLRSNKVSDITPLTGLVNLMYICLNNKNQISGTQRHELKKCLPNTKIY